MRLPVLAALMLATAALSTMSTLSVAQSPQPWDYEGKQGALAWGKLNPAWVACSKGHQQAPVDIRGARLNKSLAPIEFHYIAGPITLEHNGHTIVGHVDPGSYIVAGGVRYDLVQFDFHHPSEEAVKGKLSDMDVELLHRSPDGKEAIIEVRYDEDRGAPNALLATLWQHLPKAAGKTERVTDMINPGGLLPLDHGYWTYLGSLSTPPCTEGVRWFVIEQDLTVSREQLRAFTALFKVNTRPLQETHGRRIEANE